MLTSPGRRVEAGSYAGFLPESTGGPCRPAGPGRGEQTALDSLAQPQWCRGSWVPEL